MSITRVQQPKRPRPTWPQDRNSFALRLIEDYCHSVASKWGEFNRALRVVVPVKLFDHAFPDIARRLAAGGSGERECVVVRVSDDELVRVQRGDVRCFEVYRDEFRDRNEPMPVERRWPRD